MGPENKMALRGEEGGGKGDTLGVDFPVERKVRFFLSPSSSLFKTNLLIQEEQCQKCQDF